MAHNYSDLAVIRRGERGLYHVAARPLGTVQAWRGLCGSYIVPTVVHTRDESIILGDEVPHLFCESCADKALQAEDQGRELVVPQTPTDLVGLAA